MMSGAAKTVSFSPLRSKQTSLKISLDSPYQLKWPHVAPENAVVLLEELKKSLSGMKGLLSAKCRERTNTGSKRRKKRKRSRESKRNRSEGDKETLEPAAKKICLEASEDVGSTIDAALKLKGAESAGLLHYESKKSQLVVGTNALTRCLEQGTLRVGLVCLTAKPALIHKHILQLSATRCVPVAALHNLSSTVAPLLGMKSVLAIGVKKGSDGEIDSYSELVAKVTSLAPPISIPWLTSDLKAVGELEGSSKSYFELNVKKTISRPKSKGKC